jgi:hypothetical protein
MSACLILEQRLTWDGRKQHEPQTQTGVEIHLPMALGLCYKSPRLLKERREAPRPNDGDPP